MKGATVRCDFCQSRNIIKGYIDSSTTVGCNAIFVCRDCGKVTIE